MKAFSLRQTLLLLFTLLSVIILWGHLPMSDKESYFDFADKRTLLFIQNAGDVLSNLPFMLVGIWGFMITSPNQHLLPGYKNALRVLAVGTFLTCFGSMYFHLNPNLDTLFWDRLPMTIGFTGLVILLVLDRLSTKWASFISYPLLAMAMATTLGWHLGWLSLRPYLIVQFGCLIFSILTVLFTPSNLVKNSSILIAIGFYVLAKVSESSDLLLFQKLNFISGHTLKHLLAATALLAIFYPFYKKKNARTRI